MTKAPAMTVTTGSAELLALVAEIQEFDSFLNKPPEYEDRTMVREYRHAAYAKWSLLCRKLVSRLAAKPAEEVREATIEECAKIADKVSTSLSEYSKRAEAAGCWGGSLPDLSRCPNLPPSPAVAAEPVVAWRYRNDLGEITSDWIDGPVPEYLRDATTNERIVTSGMKIDRAYANPTVRGDREAIMALIEKHVGATMDLTEGEGVLLGVGEAADAILSAVQPDAGEREGSYQARVNDWLMACFGETIARDRIERNHRFVEEALELVQANGCSASEAHQLVDYVYGRPVGDLHQEVGGVMNTLAALCLASGVDLNEAAEAELARVWTMVEKIRAKQAAKPKHSPLPELSRQAPHSSSEGGR